MYVPRPDYSVVNQIEGKAHRFGAPDAKMIPY
jgi:hypothetical protein